MKIVIAPDKFKGSLSGLEFCNAVIKGLNKHLSGADIVKLPLADGGDGTIEVLQYYLKGEMVKCQVSDPLFRSINASYLYSENQKTAYIEMAEASGIRLLKKHELNPLETTTFGTGQLILDAIDKDANHIILGIGGSATNDAGIGMASALGFAFYDANGNKLKGQGRDLNVLTRIDASNVHPQLKNIKFDVACDVDNPLYGLNGAAHIYSPQKGATTDMVHQLNEGLVNFNNVVKTVFKRDLQHIAGAGAAGGLGAGCILFLNAALNPGIDLIKQVADFDNQIKDADWIITGEGKFDAQTFSGKVIKGVMDSIKDQKVCVFCGISELDSSHLKNLNINYLKQTIDFAMNIDDSIQNSEKYLIKAAEQFALTINQ